MTYKTILAHLSDRKRAPRVLETALDLATRLDAHLIALHVIPMPYVPIAPYGDASGGIVELERQALQTQALEIEALFARAAADRPGRGEMRCAEARLGPVADVVTLHARSADLAVLPWPEPGIRLDYHPTDVSEDVMMGAGRPVLLVPDGSAPANLAGRVLIAWNGSREASRAVFDAIPLLLTAREVRLLTIGKPASGRDSADIVHALGRHGVPVTATAVGRAQAGIAEELKARIADLGADLLVMGGYGHARLREAVLGGATSGILSGTAVPVLMSH